MNNNSTTSERDTLKIPFYENYIFICICFMLWPAYGVPLLVGIFCLRKRLKDFPTVTPEYFQEHLNTDIIRKENENLITDLKQEQDSLISNLSKKKNKLSNEIDNLKKEKKDIEFFIKDNIDDSIFAQTIVDFSDEITSNEIKNELSLINIEEKELIKSDNAFDSSNTLNMDREQKKHAKQLLRAFNAETEYYLSNVTINNINTYRNKITKSFESLNKLFEVDNVGLSKDVLILKLKKLDIIFQYQNQLAIERELLKVQREEIREQQKIEKELKDAKKKIEKEEKQFNNELAKLLKYLNGAQNEVEQNIYADKIKELQEKIKLLEKDKENILEREANTRAGFVYIISNIGSFGENIYKIGMTRRLEPMDRINELSSASVPFPFDVHAMIFSEDAPKLESTLHQHFRKYEVNKVNPRKEFFKVDLNEVKTLVHKEFNNTVTFYDKAKAEQYYASLKQDN